MTCLPRWHGILAIGWNYPSALMHQIFISSRSLEDPWPLKKSIVQICKCCIFAVTPCKTLRYAPATTHNTLLTNNFSDWDDLDKDTQIGIFGAVWTRRKLTEGTLAGQFPLHPQDCHGKQLSEKIWNSFAILFPIKPNGMRERGSFNEL